MPLGVLRRQYRPCGCEGHVSRHPERVGEGELLMATGPGDPRLRPRSADRRQPGGVCFHGEGALTSCPGPGARTPGRHPVPRPPGTEPALGGSRGRHGPLRVTALPGVPARAQTNRSTTGVPVRLSGAGGTRRTGPWVRAGRQETGRVHRYGPWVVRGSAEPGLPRPVSPLGRTGRQAFRRCARVRPWVWCGMAAAGVTGVRLPRGTCRPPGRCGGPGRRRTRRRTGGSRSDGSRARPAGVRRRSPRSSACRTPDP